MLVKESAQLFSISGNTRPDLSLKRSIIDDIRPMPTCNHCGAFVSPEFVRVFGDNHGVLPGCLSCATATDVRTGFTDR